MTSRRPHAPRAFTLVELIGVMVVLGVLAAVAGPLLTSGADAYHRAATQRDALERASFAMDRTLGLLRDAPESPSGSGAPAFTTAEPRRFAFADGRTVEWRSGALWAVVPGQPGGEAPLCANVDDFSLTYLGADGVTDTLASPGQTTRVEVSITTGGVTLRSAAFLRVTGGAP